MTLKYQIHGRPCLAAANSSNRIALRWPLWSNITTLTCSNGLY